MRGQFLVRRVQIRLVAARLAHPGLLVVRDHEFGHPAPKLEHPDVRHRPVRQRAAPGYVHEGVVRGAEDADEDHGVVYLPGAPVHDRELRARVVDEHLLARPVDLPHDHVELLPPCLVALAEPTVLIPRSDEPHGTPATTAAASRPCGAEAPGGHLPSPAPAGEPAMAAGAGTAPPPAQCRPTPPATARRSPPRLPAARSRSPCCWRCRARSRSRGGCARARTSGAAVLESSAWTT